MEERRGEERREAFVCRKWGRERETYLEMVIYSFCGATKARDVDGRSLHGERHEGGRRAKGVFAGKTVGEASKVDIPTGVDGGGELFPSLVHLLGIVGIGGVDEVVATGRSIGFSTGRSGLLRLCCVLIESSGAEDGGSWEPSRGRRASSSRD
jgi:hypothetical protein